MSAGCVWVHDDAFHGQAGRRCEGHAGGGGGFLSLKLDELTRFRVGAVIFNLHLLPRRRERRREEGSGGFQLIQTDKWKRFCSQTF